MDKVWPKIVRAQLDGGLALPATMTVHFTLPHRHLQDLISAAPGLKKTVPIDRSNV